jgi:hypothetical protein
MEGHDMLTEVDLPRAERPALAEQSPGTGPHGGAVDSLGRVLAMLLLPLSIVPVLLLGPSVLRAPVALSREAWGDVQRLERSLLPARHTRHAIAESDPTLLPTVSLGPVYGRWTAFPQRGRTQLGSLQLGPEDRTR